MDSLERLGFLQERSLLGDDGIDFIFNSSSKEVQGLAHEVSQGSLLEALGEGIIGDEPLDGVLAFGQMLYVEGAGLDIAEAKLEFAMNQDPGADGKGFLQKRAVETDQDSLARIVHHPDFQGFHPSETEPLMGKDHRHGENLRCLGELGERRVAGSIFIGPGIMGQEIPDGYYSESCQFGSYLRSGASQVSYGLPQFMDEHPWIIA
ncbi:MAG: hypothetical protein FD137_357 [Spirochaetes bacterium]|nr:MAG: hypothetical protein FD137_357 [Spirochaetota bacterium]